MEWDTIAITSVEARTSGNVLLHGGAWATGQVGVATNRGSRTSSEIVFHRCESVVATGSRVTVASA